jgi:hypothetical protein
MPVVDEIVANLPRHNMILGHRGGYAGAAYLQPGHPRQFLERHGSGARFSVLPAPIRAATLHQASDWATERFGSLDALFRESFSYELSFFQPQPVKPH